MMNHPHMLSSSIVDWTTKLDSGNGVPRTSASHVTVEHSASVTISAWTCAMPEVGARQRWANC